MYSLVYSLLLAGVHVNYYSINRGVGLPLQRAQDYSLRQWVHRLSRRYKSIRRLQLGSFYK